MWLRAKEKAQKREFLGHFFLAKTAVAIGSKRKKGWEETPAPI